MATSSARAIGDGGFDEDLQRRGQELAVGGRQLRLRLALTRARAQSAAAAGGRGTLFAGLPGPWRSSACHHRSAVALLRLHAPKPAIKAIAARQQRLVGALLHDRAIFDRDNAIAMAHRREPVGDDDHSAPSHDLAHVGLNSTLALVIQRACRLVKDQDARLGDERARDGRCAGAGRPRGWHPRSSI